jgi:valyl-tRNA synthetase
MPFITEEIWHALYDSNSPVKSIALAEYPTGIAHLDDEAVLDMVGLQSLIVEVRALRKEIGVEEKAVAPIEVRTGAVMQAALNQNSATVERLARVSDIRMVDQVTAGLAKHSTPSFDVAVVYERTIDVSVERERLKKEIAQHEKNIANAERQLGNAGFLEKAPAHIVEGLKKQRDEAKRLLDKARGDLDALPE